MPTLDSIAERESGASACPAERSRQAEAPAVRWLVPDLALSAGVITLIYLMLFFGGATALFRDADAGWHIRTGERILSTGLLPHVDPFSFSKPGEPWIAWEWGADVLAGAVNRMAGLSGVGFVYSLAIGASVWMWFRLTWAAGGNFLLACLFASPMLSTVNLHWLARPHVFGWLFLLGTVWYCERLRPTAPLPSRFGMNSPGMGKWLFSLANLILRRKAATAPLPSRFRMNSPGIGWQHLAAAALFAAVWANVHGSFFLGPLVAIIYAVGMRLRPPGSSGYLRLALALIAGSFANPNGWHLHQHVFGYLANSALLDRIGEFQSFNFHADGAAQIIIALLIGVAGGCAALSAGRPERFLLSMLFAAGALRSARMLPVLALILLPLANGSITAVLVKARVDARFRAWLDGFLDYGLGLRALDRRMNGFALIPVVALALFAVIRASNPGFPADQFPVAASNAITALPGSARVFAPDKFGGYLIYRFAGERKVFFDGRSDFYGADFLIRYARMVQVRPGWNAGFAKWRFTHALVPPDYSLVPALGALGWKEIYRDRTAVLLEAPGA